MHPVHNDRRVKHADANTKHADAGEVEDQLPNRGFGKFEPDHRLQKDAHPAHSSDGSGHRLDVVGAVLALGPVRQGHCAAKNAGENLADVLKHCAAELPPPIQMCDALSRNAPKLSAGVEILLARNARETMSYLRDIPEKDRREIGARARARVLGAHTAAHRAIEFEEAVAAAGLRPASPPAAASTPRAPIAETVR